MFIDKYGYKHIEKGDIFGKLTVTGNIKYHIQPSGQKKKLYECKCNCGNITNVREENLKTGHTTSCGHCNDIHIGDKFGRLTVIDKTDDYIKPTGEHRHCWVCKCNCGNIITIRGDDLISHHTISCGCLRKEKSTIRLTTHGLSKTKLYKIYTDIKYRCYNSNSTGYEDYGGRGIKVCNEWLNKDNGFINFYNWAINNGYRDDLTIDRINVNGNYEPSNCRWIPKEYQAENKRNSRYVYFNGEKFTIPQFANILGITFELLIYRLKKNNYNLSSLFTYITDQYGNTKSYILDKYNNPIPINGIYFIDEYGFPINMNNYNKDE